MASLFFVAIWVDPAQPLREASFGAACLIAYIVWSALILVVAFRDWWAEFRLARLALWIDCLAGIASVYFTDGPSQDFSTPLAALFVFALVSATLLGGWRTALTVGVVVPAGLLAVAVLLAYQDIGIDPNRVGRRVGYFLVIAALFVWYGGRRGLPVAPALATVPQPGNPVPLSEALGYAADTFGGRRGFMAWDPGDGTQAIVQLDASDAPAEDARNAARSLLGGERPEAPQLIKDASRALTLDREYRTVAQAAPVVAAASDADDGATLVIPVRASKGEGVVVLGNLRTPGRDLLPLGVSVGREIASAFDRHSASLTSYREGLGQLRETVARDLHDSVAQSLAGASFRVDAARKAIATGRPPDAELGAVSDALRAEQRHLRTIIERLREGREVPVRHDLADDIGALLAEASSQWRVATSLERPESPIKVGPGQVHDLRQIVREAVANAAKHGHAGEVRVTLEAADRVFFMDIVDDGASPEISAVEFRPRSIADRVAALGGKLEARRGPAGARLYITVPRLSA